uniref:Fucosyltransferase n=1 Tax=Lepisosteus oculatus TaxID=7918 RepID=W5NNA6_LEPOC
LIGKIMSSASVHGILRPLLIATLFLGCFVTFIIMYIKPSSSWISGPIESATSVLKVKNLFSSKNDLNHTVILIWLWPFGQTFELNSCNSLFQINGCHLTVDRNLYNKSDAVLLHHRDISRDLVNLPPMYRPPFQKWVWMNLESPTHSPKTAGLENLFNVTLSYRRDSDIEVPYGSLISSRIPTDFEVPVKNKLVCWIVSNWNPEHARVKYYNDLYKHIEINTYGQAFGEYVSDKNFLSTIASCKFYLSFENSIHRDYITEKLYNALSVGTVPIVLGPSRENYENYIPGDAFIHVDDFLSPKELADYLLVLDKNEDMYLQYVSWHKYFKVKKSFFWEEHACLTCDYIKRHKEYKTIPNLEKWFW